MSSARILAVYRLIFSALVIVASVQALVAAHIDRHYVYPLATTEVAGALMLVCRRTQRLGAGLLLGVFACAQVISASEGRWPTHFLQYAASTILIVTLDRTLANSR